MSLSLFLWGFFLVVGAALNVTAPIRLLGSDDFPRLLIEALTSVKKFLHVKIFLHKSKASMYWYINISMANVRKVATRWDAKKFVINKLITQYACIYACIRVYARCARMHTRTHAYMHAYVCMRAARAYTHANKRVHKTYATHKVQLNELFSSAMKR